MFKVGTPVLVVGDGNYRTAFRGRVGTISKVRDLRGFDATAGVWYIVDLDLGTLESVHFAEEQLCEITKNATPDQIEALKNLYGRSNP